MLKTNVLVVFLLLLTNLANASTCNNSALYACQNQLANLNQSYNSLQNRYNALNASYLSLTKENQELIKNLTNVTSERDLYKTLYYNSSLNKLSVGDFLALKNNINYTYVRVNQSLTQIKNSFEEKVTQINMRINNFYFIVVIAVVFEIAVLQFKLLDLILRVKVVNKVHKRYSKWVRESKFIKQVSTFIFVTETKSETKSDKHQQNEPVR